MQKFNYIFLSASNNQVAPKHTFTGLTQNTHYVARLVNGSTVIARRCFRTAIDTTTFNTLLPSAANMHRIQTGDTDGIDLNQRRNQIHHPDNFGNTEFASGCFAFGGTRAQINACMCGARNAAGTEWRATDVEAGFTWITTNQQELEAFECPDRDG